MDHLPADHFVTSIQFTKHVYQDQYPSIDPTNPQLSLAGRAAIITGASRGIGAKGFAPAFAKAGVKTLILIATGEEKLEAVEAEVHKINPTIQVLRIGANITDAASVDAAFERIKAVGIGHADILINNAGVNTDGGVLLADEEPESWWQNFEVNARGTFLVSRAFIRQLPDPLKTRANIITLVTGAAWLTFPNLSGYGISKQVALSLSQHIAAGYPNISAVALHPGLVDTDMLLDSFRHFTLETPALVGGLAVWLTNPSAKFLSGRTIASQWSVDDLLERKDEIVEKDLLKLNLTGEFNAGQA
ncbi:hypothetical protein ACHAPJ_010382 [Fusarium lateritium]